MPQLLDLVNETLLQICDDLEIRDVYDLSCSNKFLYDLAEEKRYTSIRFGGSSRRSERLTDPFVFLQQMLLSSHLAARPKTVTIEDSCRRVRSGEINQEVLDGFHNFMSSTTLYIEKKCWHRPRMVGSSACYYMCCWGYAVITALALMPNVRVTNGFVHHASSWRFAPDTVCSSIAYP